MQAAALLGCIAEQAIEAGLEQILEMMESTPRARPIRSLNDGDTRSVLYKTTI